MADDSEKEKISAVSEEKEEDTSIAVGSKPNSKPGSAKSGAGSKPGTPSKSARTKSPKSGRSDKSGKKSGKKKTASAKTENEDAASQDHDNSNEMAAKIAIFEFPDELPDGASSLFLSSKTQEIFDLGDGNATEHKLVKIREKSAILGDIQKRAAVSDFSPIKKKIIEYPEDYLVIIADLDYKFGENFIIVLSVEAKDILLVAPEVKKEGEEEEELENVVYTYVPPVPKDWVSQGSEKEVKEESLVTNRPLISQSIVRVRRDFGAPITFKDRNVGDAKDAYIECTAYEDPNYDVVKAEQDCAVQAIPETFNVSSQTEWKYPKNANTQYEYRTFTEEQQAQELKKDHLNSFMTEVRPRFEEALQQNEIMNVFYDDWMSLSSDDNTFGNKADSHLKEFQSFTDLLFSKEKTITCIDWHPTIKGLVAVSVAQKLTFDARVDNSNKIIMTPSLVLIWSFVDPIHPLLLLEAPDDIYCFRFCPTEPNYVAGGCLNGQIVMWDLSAHSERLMNQRSNKQEKKKNTLNTLPGYADENPLETPIVRYTAVSSIEYSHKAAITDLLWIPDHMELNRMGVAQESRSGQCVQIMTAAADHSVLVWDTRPASKADQKKGSEHSNMGTTSPLKHLDLNWRPSMKVYLHKSEPGGDHNPTVFSISEVQGDKSVLTRGSEELKESMGTGGHFSTGVPKPSSGKEKRTLTGVNTHFYCGTEDGDIVYLDWMPQKDQDSGKIQTPKPDYYHGMHDGRIVCLQRSPFFRDVVLCVGGWTFSIWKEGLSSGPILKSPTNKKQLTSGFWSPSRPGVFYIAREDGSVDIWDLLEKTHEPSMNQNVSAHPLTCIYPFQITHRQHLLAVGDNSGTLHVMEIPWSLRHPTAGEQQGVQAYLDREVARRNFVVERWKFREEEKREIEAEHKKKMGIAPGVTLTDEEKDMRDKNEYNAFLEEERNFLRLLGILKEEDEVLPET
ncbi:dynein axonemal intermediate chain 3-like [Watersipora subatra]|uniref:dynein axonemal intermediate chain 3-like n=1 Tax=Watersipora subatra TaxID=2589382 RepID=UPI00355B2DEF